MLVFTHTNGIKIKCGYSCPKICSCIPILLILIRDRQWGSQHCSDKQGIWGLSPPGYGRYFKSKRPVKKGTVRHCHAPQLSLTHHMGHNNNQSCSFVFFFWVAADSMTAKSIRSLLTATTIAFAFISVLITMSIAHYYVYRCLQK